MDGVGGVHHHHEFSWQMTNRSEFRKLHTLTRTFISLHPAADTSNRVEEILKVKECLHHRFSYRRREDRSSPPSSEFTATQETMSWELV